MASDFESNREEADIENLPTPGAMRWGYSWRPTLDGEPIPIHDPSWFESREEAWAEAIKRVKLRASLAIEIELGRLSGCLIDEWTVIVETVTEAREVILRHVVPSVEGQKRGPGTQGPESRSDPTWEDLAEYEDGRRYDPGNPEAGMRCSYSLSETEWMEGVGGILWPVSDHRWATAPPEVWDHSADQPVGLDNDADPGDNGLESDSDDK